MPTTGSFKTRRGQATLELILEETKMAFFRDSFHGTSVAGICRKAGLSNGIFYKYFPNKIAAFKALMSNLKSEFLLRIKDACDVATSCDLVFDFFSEAGHLFQIFREAEFLGIQSPREMFYDEAIPLLTRTLGTDEETAWGAFGSMIMVGLRYGIWENRPVPRLARKAFLDILLNGIAPGKSDIWKDLSLPAGQGKIAFSAEPESSNRAQNTRLSILNSAYRLFAQKGYTASHIHHITDGAKVALGTYYLYFSSKREILAEIVSEIRRQMQARVAQSVVGITNRLEFERVAFLAFLAFTEENKDIYRIVREAEFAEPAIGRGYYQNLHRDWSALLEAAQLRGDLRKADPKLQACFLMGAVSLAGMRWGVWCESSDRVSRDAGVRATLRLIIQGLST